MTLLFFLKPIYREGTFAPPPEGKGLKKKKKKLPKRVIKLFPGLNMTQILDKLMEQERLAGRLQQELRDRREKARRNEDEEIALILELL